MDTRITLMDGADDFLDIDDTEIPGTEAVED